MTNTDTLGLPQRFTQQHIALLGFLPRHQKVRLLEERRRNFVDTDEGIDIDRLVGFRSGFLQCLCVDNHVTTLAVFERLDDILPRHFLAGLRIHALVTDRLLVARIEHLEMQVGTALSRHQRDRHV